MAKNQIVMLVGPKKNLSTYIQSSFKHLFSKLVTMFKSGLCLSTFGEKTCLPGNGL